MQTCYVVVKEGSYPDDGYDVFGPYGWKREARIAAQTMAASCAPEDRYHHWDVRRMSPKGLREEVLGSYRPMSDSLHDDVLRELSLLALQDKMRTGKPIPVRELHPEQVAP